jgi:hypothetical protein
VRQFGFALALAIVGMAIGYASAMPFLPASGWLPAGLVGAGLGLAMARALWITRHGAGAARSSDPEPEGTILAEPDGDDRRR